MRLTLRRLTIAFIIGTVGGLVGFVCMQTHVSYSVRWFYAAVGFIVEILLVLFFAYEDDDAI